MLLKINLKLYLCEDLISGEFTTILLFLNTNFFLMKLLLKSWELQYHEYYIDFTSHKSTENFD